MPYSKRIVCLANSRKNNARCVAGKETSGQGAGAWIRPVSGRPSEEISVLENRIDNRREIRVGDIVDIRMIEARAHNHQTENHLIDSASRWQLVRKASWQTIGALVETPATLWINNEHSTNGINDRIEEDKAHRRLRNSLFLIQPENLVVRVSTEYGNRKKIRADFDHNGHFYRLAVTDPAVEAAYMPQPTGTYPIADALLCVSLGEGYRGHVYKFVASILRANRFGR